jgi:branched-chain amino acid transport system ATP-binding protein
MSGLEARGMTVRFGGVVALVDVDLTVERGAVVGLIGPNGAGKTTLIDAVTGFVPSSGVVTLDGRPIDTLSPHRRVRAGLVRTFQSGGLFSELTLEENLTVVSRDRSHHRRQSAEELLDAFGLGDVKHERPTDLSHGRQRLAGLARAMFQDPAVVLLDEPAAGLDSTETEALIEPVKQLAAHGVGVLLIDHDVDFVARTCTIVSALDFGQVVAHGTPTEVLESDAVRQAYLGDVGGEAA